MNLLVEKPSGPSLEDPLSWQEIPWLGKNYRLWSLIDVVRFNADSMARVVSRFSRTAYLMFHDESGGHANSKQIATVRRVLECTEPLGLRVFQDRLSSVYRRMEDEPIDAYASTLWDCYLVLLSELKAVNFIWLPPASLGLYEGGVEALYGTHVAERLPSANLDLEQAAKCLALDLPTACVMHLMRAIEIAVRAVRRSLGVGEPDPLKPNEHGFGAEFGTIRDKIKANKNAPPRGWTPEKLAFYEELQAYLGGAKDAWRNHAAHASKSYSEAEARRIYDSVRSFMQHFATHLDERGKFVK